jgi:hypothetical protein
MVSHHNTTRETLRLPFYEDAAKSLESEIVAWWVRGARYTPLQVADRFPSHLDISIKRAITNLTKRGILRKTGERVMERRGRPNYLWTRD